MRGIPRRWENRGQSAATMPEKIAKRYRRFSNCKKIGWTRRPGRKKKPISVIHPGRWAEKS